MSRAIRWLRASYWTGAVADALASIEMLFPGALATLSDDAGPAVDVDLRLAQAFGAPLMIGWTALLLWADRKPLERRGVLVLTVFPVLTGLLVRGVIGAAVGAFTGTTAVVAIAPPIFLIALMTLSLWLARREAAHAGRE